MELPSDDRPRRTRRRDLWAHADFKRLWAAQAISAFGSRITRTALPIIAVAALEQSESTVGLLASLSLAPGAVLALFAGGFVDRGHKRRLLLAADLVRAAMVASLTIAWALGALSMIHVIAVGAIVGAASALDQIAGVSYLPALIDRSQLLEGNAKLETTEAIAEISGPASAGVLIAALGAPIAVVIDAAGYLWSAFILRRIRTPEPPPAPPKELASTSMWQTTMDLRVGIRAVFGHHVVRPVVLALMWANASYGFFAALYTLLCLRTLHLSQATFGVIVAMGGIGSILGAQVARPLARRFGIGPTILWSLAASVVMGLLIPLAGGSVALAIAMLATHQLVADGFAVVFNIHQVSLRQTVLPTELLGRANAAIHAFTAGLVPFCAIAGGVIAQLTSIRFAMWIGVLLALLAPVMLWPLRRVRSIPAAENVPADDQLRAS